MCDRCVDTPPWAPVIGVIGIIMILVTLFVYALENEIGTTNYATVIKFLNNPASPPELIDKIHETMEDEKITNTEFKEIVRMRNKAYKDNTKNTLVEQIRR